MKKLLLLMITGLLGLSACTQTDVPKEHKPFPQFPSTHEVPFDQPHGTVSLADSAQFWIINELTYNDYELIDETAASGTEIKIMPLVISSIIDTAVQNKINKAIADKIVELKKYAEFSNLPVYRSFYTVYPSKSSGIDGIGIYPSVRSIANNILSIEFTIAVWIKNKMSNYETEDFQIKDSLNFDLNTGNEVTLSDLFVNGSDYESALNMAILMKSQSKTEPLPGYGFWEQDTYQYVGGFTGIEGDVKFFLTDESIVLIFNPQYEAFINGFSTTLISVNMETLIDILAYGQRFTQNNQQLTLKTSTRKNYLYPVETVRKYEQINNITVLSNITRLIVLTDFYKTLRDGIIASDYERIAAINDPNIKRLDYDFTAVQSGPYLNITSLIFTGHLYYVMNATYKPDGTKLTFSDVFADGFDYETYYKNLIMEDYEQNKEMYDAPIDPDLIYDEMAKSLMIRKDESNCLVTLTNDFIQDFSWDPGYFFFSVEITDDPSMFKIKPW